MQPSFTALLRVSVFGWQKAPLASCQSVTWGGKGFDQPKRKGAAQSLENNGAHYSACEGCDKLVRQET